MTHSKTLLLAGAAALCTAVPAQSFVDLNAAKNSRVIVSTTLNDQLHVYDASTLAELHPPLTGKGSGPVRLYVEKIAGVDYLFTANHGVGPSSVGVFDLSGDVPVELPASPFPARFGAVGVTAGGVLPQGYEGDPIPMVFVTNTYFALGGCSMPTGSVTAYDATTIASQGLAGVLDPIATVEISGAIPYAVAINEELGQVYTAVNCSDSLDTIQMSYSPADPFDPSVVSSGGAVSAGFGMSAAVTASRPVGDGPDGSIFDNARGRSYTVNISGSTLAVHSADSPEPLTIVPLRNAEDGRLGPIELNFADTPGGQSLLVTANGRDHGVSFIDRDILEACIEAEQTECPEAEILRVATTGGSPEGIDYDSKTNRVFVSTKPVPAPNLVVISLTEKTLPATGEFVFSAKQIATIPLSPLGDTVNDVPSLIAFDVVVQER